MAQEVKSVSKKKFFKTTQASLSSSLLLSLCPEFRASKKALDIWAQWLTSPSFLGTQTTDGLYLFSSAALEPEQAHFLSVMNSQLAIGSSIRKCKDKWNPCVIQRSQSSQSFQPPEGSLTVLFTPKHSVLNKCVDYLKLIPLRFEKDLKPFMVLQIIDQSRLSKPRRSPRR